MSSVTSLLDFILNLLRDPQAQAEFKANPQAVLADNGLTGVCAADIHDTLPLVTDNRAVGRPRPRGERHPRRGPLPELHHQHVHLHR